MSPTQPNLPIVAFATLGATVSMASATENSPAPELDKVVSGMSGQQAAAEPREAARVGSIARAGLQQVSLLPTPAQLVLITPAGLHTRVMNGAAQ